METTTNPFQTGTTLQQAIDEDYNGFCDKLIEQDNAATIDAAYDWLQDQITLNSSGEEPTKDPVYRAWNWANRNYYELDFTLQIGSGYHCHYKQGEYYPDEGGIFVGYMLSSMSEEVEVQAEDGALCYIYTGLRNLLIFAKVG